MRLMPHMQKVSCTGISNPRTSLLRSAGTRQDSRLRAGADHACEGAAHRFKRNVTTVISDPALTSEGATVGTVAYMSPEQAQGKPLDSRTDLFSFGVVLYEMATGVTSFSRAIRPRVYSYPFFSSLLFLPVRLNPDVPASLEEIINKCLEKDREIRYQHAADIRSDLKRLKRDTDSHQEKSFNDECGLADGHTGSCLDREDVRKVAGIETAPDQRIANFGCCAAYRPAVEKSGLHQIGAWCALAGLGGRSSSESGGINIERHRLR